VSTRVGGNAKHKRVTGGQGGALMHLLLAQKGTLSDGDGEALDLGQTPGHICFLSAADTELASLAGAHQERGSKRCASSISCN
jgi:hypothetical protein